MFGPIVNDRMEVTLIRKGQVQSFRLCVDLRPSYAGLANSGGVNERCDFLRVAQSSCQKMPARMQAYLDVPGQQAVKEMDICGLEPCEVLEFLEVRLLEAENL